MNALYTRPPVLGLAGFSGSGKTTLLTALLPLLEMRGLRVGVIKHSHHDFEIDQPGKDSFLLRKAGARQILIASPFRTVLIQEHRHPTEPELEELLNNMNRQALDLILVEGFRHVSFPKLEIHRAETQKSFLHPLDPSIIAVATNTGAVTHLPRLNIDDPEEIALFIREFITSIQSGSIT